MNTSLNWLLLREALCLCALGFSVACVDESSDAPPGAGSAAADYVLDAPYSNIKVEVDIFGQVPANSFVRDVALGQAKKLLNKPGEVSTEGVRVDREYVPPLTGFDVPMLEALEKEHRTTFSSGDTAAIYVLYLPGHSAYDTDDRKVMGVAYGPTSMAIFVETVERSCGAGKAAIDDPEARALLCPLTEAATWLHELGHLVGLVDNGIPMVTPHLDVDHGAHDTNENCIMHWTHASGDVAKFIERRLKAGNKNLDVYGQNCHEDIEAFKANGGM